MSRISLGFAAVLLAIAFRSSAEQQCFCELRGHSSWRPKSVAATETGIRVRLVHSGDRRIADLYLDAESGVWRHNVPADADASWNREQELHDRATARCQAIPYKQLDHDEAVRVRPHLRVGHAAEETPEACFHAAAYVWFGLGFYEGEGADGIGGVGRYTPADGTVEVRRPEWLRDKSIDHVVHDGRWLWISVHQAFEKDGRQHGLARYDWDRDELSVLAGTGDGPCGIAIQGLLLRDGALWVVGDLALSKLDLASRTWSHFRPDRIGSTMVPATCGSIYSRVVAGYEECPAFCGDGESIPELLARFAPDEMRASLARRPLATWDYAEYSAAGMVARDFDELNRLLLRRWTKDTKRADNLRWALVRFAEKKVLDDRWRDYAVAFARTSRDLEPIYYFRGDPNVAAFLRELVQGSPNRAAVRTLPFILGPEAIPILIRLLDVVPHEFQMGRAATLPDVIESLERATHLRIEADGSSTPLAANSDTPEYAEEEYGAFWRATASEEELSKIVGLWKVWWKELEKQ